MSDSDRVSDHLCNFQRPTIWWSHQLYAVNGQLCGGEKEDKGWISLASSLFSFVTKLFAVLYLNNRECLPREAVWNLHNLVRFREPSWFWVVDEWQQSWLNKSVFSWGDQLENDKSYLQFIYPSWCRVITQLHKCSKCHPQHLHHQNKVVADVSDGKGRWDCLQSEWEEECVGWPRMVCLVCGKCIPQWWMTNMVGGYWSGVVARAGWWKVINDSICFGSKENNWVW